LREHLKLEGGAMEEILNAQVVLDGIQRAVVTLDESGLLRWRGDKQQGQLLVRDDLIGFSSSSSACKLLLHTFKMTESTKLCGKGLPGRKRKEIIIEFDTDAALQLWCEAIQRILDESGSVLPSFLCFFFFFPPLLGINP